MKTHLDQNKKAGIHYTNILRSPYMFKKKDTITRLPSDPKKLEAYFKTLPPEVIEGFAQNSLKEDEGQDDSEMGKLIDEIIFRLAWTNKHGPITGKISDEQIQLLKKEFNSREKQIRTLPDTPSR